ncbi:MAG: reverse transcriptase-like protein, partial [Candidatus Vogelbacteria bacterium]|nr:reverse transcriptase-like protein [Candidatus Vogelbacteria bacterium]
AKVADFKNLTHHYIPREENRAADRLANEAMAGAAAGSNELF